MLDAGGVVFGAGFDENLQVRHISIKNKEDIRKIRGSKYVQSKIGDTYSEAKEYLQKGIKVLFAGTPCQISGLKSYLGKDYDNLILMDIICHGVPSPKVWKKYLDYIEKSKIKITIQILEVRDWVGVIFLWILISQMVQYILNQ